MAAKVVISGTGMVTPIGNNAEETFGASLEGKTNFRLHERLQKAEWADGQAAPSALAGWPKDLDAEQWVPKKEARRTDPFIVYSIIAAHQAWENAQQPEKLDKEDGNRAGTLFGCGWNGVGTILDTWDLLRDRGPRRVSPFFIPSVIGNLTAGHIGMRFNLRGPNWTPSSAGASGSHAVGEGLVHIRDGRCHTMMTGGADAVAHTMVYAAFNNAGLLTLSHEEDRAAPVRAFDKARDGTALSEGAGAILLEEEGRADARGATKYCELAGYCSVFATDLDWHQSPEHTVRAIEGALADAGLKPEDIDYINPNGMGTVQGDAAEVAAIEQVFGAHAKNIAVSSTKSATGHMLAASGAVEAGVCAHIIHSGRIPPSVGLTDPAFDLDFVTEARDAEVKNALSLNFGMGGNHTALVFKAL